LIARLALIAEDVCFFDVIPKVRKYLKEIIELWLDGTFKENGFLYDQEYGEELLQNKDVLTLVMTLDLNFILLNHITRDISLMVLLFL
jgi:hypothetical protein